MTIEERLQQAVALAAQLHALDGKRAGLEFALDRGWAGKADEERLDALMAERQAPVEGLLSHFAALASEHSAGWNAWLDEGTRRLTALAASNDDNRLEAAAALYHWNDWRLNPDPSQAPVVTFSAAMATLGTHRQAIERLLSPSNQYHPAESNLRSLAARLDARHVPQLVPFEPRDPTVLPFPAFGLIAGPEGARHLIAVTHGVMVFVQGSDERDLRTDQRNGVKLAGDAVATALDLWIAAAPQPVGLAEAVVFAHAQLANDIPGETWVVGVSQSHGSVRLVRGGRRLLVGIDYTLSRKQVTARVGDYSAVISTPKDAVAPELMAAVRGQLMTSAGSRHG